MPELLDLLENSLKFDGRQVTITDEPALRAHIHKLARVAAIGSDPKQSAQARFLIRLIAAQLGIYPASIHDLYIARGAGAVLPTWTTPALNLRALPFDSARAAFRSARKIDSALMIFEIARVELAWAGMSLAEYAACVLAAAIAEGYRGPVFLQGDHFQISSQAPIEQEKEILQQLARQAVAAGFYNLDVDTSTLVDLSQPTVPQQQTVNATLSAELAAFIRRLQPPSVTISIGGEIGEVGGHVSTLQELGAYLDLFNQAFAASCPGQPGLSKVSIHSGSTHGGVVLPNGEIAKAPIDFQAIQELGRAARRQYGLGGVVQHGASTLAYENFDRFVQSGAVEVHLATAFMTTFFAGLPASLKHEIHLWLDHSFANERTSQMTDVQFYHRTHMRALAPFKEAIWSLPAASLQQISLAWEAQFDQLFTRLGCANTRLMVSEVIKPVLIAPTPEDAPTALTDLGPAGGLAG